jgi:putative hydrolase of the HAD superfamily
MSALRGILFDYSGTVLISDKFDLKAGLEEMCSHFNLKSKSDLNEIVDFASELELRFQELRNQTVLEFSFDRLIRIIIDYFGIRTEKSHSELEVVYYETAISYKAAPHIRQFIEQARAAGIKTGIVSNSTYPGALLQREIRKAGIEDLFDFIMSSSDYGIRKQDQLLFDVSVRKLGLKKNEVIFIGDNLDFDVVTAQSAGITAVWYNAKMKKAGDIRPDYTFEAWKDVSSSMFVPIDS